MAEAKNILASMGIDLDTKRFELKLRAIAKHAGALADELDKIDSGECTKLSEEQIELIQGMLNRNKKGMVVCSCDIKRVLELANDELPTRLEGSE